MTIDDETKDKKLQYNINKEAAKISVKLVNMNILHAKKYYPLIKNK